MTQLRRQQRSPDEWEETIEAYITWTAEWDGVLPADVFFGTLADIQAEKYPVELRARLVEGRLELSAPHASSIRVEDNHIYLEDGRELILELDA